MSTKKTRTTKPTTDLKAVEPAIYVGPNLPGGKLSRYTVFKNGAMMPHVAKLIEANPAIKSLIVPVSKLAETEQKLQDSSSVVASRYAELSKTFAKGE